MIHVLISWRARRDPMDAISTVIGIRGSWMVGMLENIVETAGARNRASAAVIIVSNVRSRSECILLLYRSAILQLHGERRGFAYARLFKAACSEATRSHLSSRVLCLWLKTASGRNVRSSSTPLQSA